MLLQSWLLHTLSAASILLDGTLASQTNNGRFGKLTIERMERAHRESERRRADLYSRQDAKTSSCRFYNSNTARMYNRSFPLVLSKFANYLKAYFIESLPDVLFDLGEIYSGNIPIDMNDTSRQLFFVFQPTIGQPVDEITIWLNGGPGCSSLEGFFQENGRFLWQSGTYAPVENPYSWVNLTNMLWYRNDFKMSHNIVS